MGHAGSSVSPSPRPVTRASEPEPILVWLAGEHDISTDSAVPLSFRPAHKPACGFTDLVGPKRAIWERTDSAPG